MVYINFDQARRSLVFGLNETIARQLKTLLETKNLYQSVEVEFKSLPGGLYGQILTEPDKRMFEQFVTQTAETDLMPSEQQVYEGAFPGYAFPRPTLLLQNVKLFCSHCGQRETFTPTVYIDSTQQLRQRNPSEPRIALPPRGFQLFALVYQCEACRAMPVGFLVKFHRWKLTIEGRSPFGEVAIPSFIPKSERKLFSNAIVASPAP